MQVGHGLFVFGFGTEFIGLKGLGTIRIQLSQFQPSFDAGQVAISLDEIGLVGRRVELGDDLPLLDRRVEIHKQLFNNAGNLAAHFHFDHRVQLAAGGRDLRQDAAGHQ